MSCLLLTQLTCTFRRFQACAGDFKNCESVLSFKIQLEEFKKRCLANSMSNDSYFWEISDIVLSKIEGSNYIINKVKHNEYLWFKETVY